MAQFKTQISALEQAASNIANLTEQFREEADQTYQATQTLSGGWTGEASDTFVENMETLRGWWNEMTATLDTYAQELQKAAQEYNEADTTSAGYFKG